MKTKRKHPDMKTISDISTLFFYISLPFLVMALITILRLPFIEEDAIAVQHTLKGWLYTVDMPLGMGSSSFEISGNIHANDLTIAQMAPDYKRHVIMTDFLAKHIVPFILASIGLYKMKNICRAVLDGKSPFQDKYLKSLRSFSYMILTYALTVNLLTGFAYTFFIDGYQAINFSLQWPGILIGIVGYMFCEITRQGMFLQEEYDTTL